MKCPRCGGVAPMVAFQRDEPNGGIDTDPLKIFIGWDSKEPVAFSVLAHSIASRASRPVSIIPLSLGSLGHIYTRSRGPTESTEFSLTRFLVPYLSGYRGHSIFMDCDMLCRADIGDVLLYVLMDPGKLVYCCQHNYTPKAFNSETTAHGLTDEYDADGHAYLAHSECGDCRAAAARGLHVPSRLKFNGAVQTDYPRKNWSSFMVFDNARCKALTPEYVNTATGLQLHRMLWAEESIGSIPLVWNWLVGEYRPNPTAQVYHYTNGGPYFEAYKDCDHSDMWWQELAAMSKTSEAAA